jgi:purine-nucleoside phosphorylase
MDCAYKEAMAFEANYEAKVRETAAMLRPEMEIAFGHVKPAFAIVLGSGLGGIAALLNGYNRIVGRREQTVSEGNKVIPYSEIPNMVIPTTKGHEGRIVMGSIEEVPAICLEGRTHFYEVARNPVGDLRVAFPIHVLAELGIENLLQISATGGVHYNVGDLMVVADFISHLPDPMAGRHMGFKNLSGELTERHQDMTNAYDPELAELLFEAGQASIQNDGFWDRFLEAASGYDRKNTTRIGTLNIVTGPSYETKAEVRAYKKLGADALGMSQGIETKIARNRGMNVAGLALITNTTLKGEIANHEEVVSALDDPQTRTFVENTIKRFFTNYRAR